MALHGNSVNIAFSSGKVKVKTTTTEVVAANENRNGLEIVNEGANSIFLQLGKAAVLNEGIFIAASGGSWNGMIGPVVWAGSVFGIAETAETSVSLAEV
jgi:hypothetical protein